jgi:hypothetical protein
MFVISYMKNNIKVISRTNPPIINAYVLSFVCGTTILLYDAFSTTTSSLCIAAALDANDDVSGVCSVDAVVSTCAVSATTVSAVLLFSTTGVIST